MVSPNITATPTPEPKKPPQDNQPAGDSEESILAEGGTAQGTSAPVGSPPKGEPDIEITPKKVNPEAVAFTAYQRALSQAAQKGHITFDDAVTLQEDKSIWTKLWLRYQNMTGFPEIGKKGFNPAQPEEVFTREMLETGIANYAQDYVVPAQAVMPEQGIDPKNWSKALSKAIDVIWDWKMRPEDLENPIRNARDAALRYATAEQAEGKDKQAYLTLLSTLNRQGYVDVYKALDQDFPAIYQRWKGLEADYPGLTRNSFDTYLNRYIGPAVGEVDPAQSATEFLEGMRRNLENLERLDTGRPIIEEPGYGIDPDTGEVVPVYPTPKGGWPEPGPTIAAKTEARNKAWQDKGYVPSPQPGMGQQDPQTGEWWITPEQGNEYIMGAGGGTGLAAQKTLAAQNKAIIDRANDLRAFEVARARTEAGQRQYAQGERIAAQVASYTGTVPESYTSDEAAKVGRYNLGLMEALVGGGSVAYERAGGIPASPFTPGWMPFQNRWMTPEERTQAGLAQLEPAPGYETRGIKAKANEQAQLAAQPWVTRRLGEPLAAQFPDLWEEYAAPRTYGWGKGAGPVPASQFTAEEPFDMPFKDFLTRRLERQAASSSRAQPLKEGEYRAPREGGPALRGTIQPPPTAGPARMTPIRIGARR